MRTIIYLVQDHKVVAARDLTNEKMNTVHQVTRRLAKDYPDYHRMYMRSRSNLPSLLPVPLTN